DTVGSCLTNAARPEIGARVTSARVLRLGDKQASRCGCTFRILAMGLAGLATSGGELAQAFARRFALSQLLAFVLSQVVEPVGFRFRQGFGGFSQLGGRVFLAARLAATGWALGFR